MGGDYTRETFNPTKGFSGVRKQQGRVSLDSDFNEFEGILDRRDRAEMYDVVGEAVVPETTPDAFLIGVAGGQLTIGVGRAYVDGILAECFGDMDGTKTVYDTHLDGVHGGGPVEFTKQPFYYSKPAFPGLAGGSTGISLLYLDVWQREVTVFEDGDLREPALNGPDTATRVQTAWQVKALQGVTADACDNPPAKWAEVIAPSTARLTAAASAVPPPPGPCVVQPNGGYSGRENRLYRVEVHKAGSLGGANKAQFKWSRDNASLAASVLSIALISASPPRSLITVSSTGRDSWMRFEHDEHLEFIDDDIELAMRETGIGGPMVSIVSVNHATGEITVDKDLATGYTYDAKRHPRIRRWDTANPAEALARDVDNGTPIPLEEGISVIFGTQANATLHAGDYWVFAARTATGEIDEVLNQPPHGALHHFAMLGVVQSGSPPKALKDCREHWPPACECEGGGCDCDACVTVGGDLTIQQAIDQVVAKGGGSVCIGIGSFRLDAGVVISGAFSLRVRGSGVGTILWFEGSGPALQVTGSGDVVVRDLTIVTERQAETEESAIEVMNSALVWLERLTVIEDPVALLELLAEGSPKRPHGAAIGLRGIVLRATVAGCQLAGGSGVAAIQAKGGDHADYLLTADLSITDNVIFARRYGVHLGQDEGQAALIYLDRTLVTANSIWGCLDGGVKLSGLVTLGQATIRGNTVGVLGDGVVASTSGTIIEANAVGSWPLERRQTRAGITLLRGDEDRLQDVAISGNRVGGFRGEGILLAADVQNVTIRGNTVRGCGGGIVMNHEDSSGDSVRIVDNTILDIEVQQRQESAGYVFGIALVGTTDGHIVGNSVRRVARDDEESDVRAGIASLGSSSVRIAGNFVEEIGPIGFRGISAGIVSTAPFERLDVVDNFVRAGEGEEVPGDHWYALLIGDPVNREGPHWGRLVNIDDSFYFAQRSAMTAVRRRNLASTTSIRGNTLEAGGSVPTAMVATGMPCTFAENWCRHLTDRAEAATAVVLLEVETLALSTNEVRQPLGEAIPAVHARIGGTATSGEPAVTYLGNITDGAIKIDPTPGTQWDPLNIRLS